MKTVCCCKEYVNPLQAKYTQRSRIGTLYQYAIPTGVFREQLATPRNMMYIWQYAKEARRETCVGAV